MTPNVLKAVRTFGIDPLKSGPWFDTGSGDGALPAPANLRTTPALFENFVICGAGGEFVFHVQYKTPLHIQVLTYSSHGKSGFIVDLTEIAGASSGSGSVIPLVSPTNQLTPDIVQNMLTAFRQFFALVHPPSSEARPPCVELQRRPPNARGKSKGYEWRVIEIEPSAPKSEPRGGTHASPRAHERRGHWVKRGDKQFWRRSCVVGDAKDGFIFHTYKAKDQPHAH